MLNLARMKLDEAPRMTLKLWGADPPTLPHAPCGACWNEQLRERARQAAENPLAARVVPELGRDDVREVFLRSYRIVTALGRTLSTC